jgi:hypothetical protein
MATVKNQHHIATGSAKTLLVTLKQGDPAAAANIPTSTTVKAVLLSVGMTPITLSHTAPGANWATGVMAVPLIEAHTLLCAGRSSVVLQIQAEGINDWFVPLAVAQGEI